MIFTRTSPDRRKRNIRRRWTLLAVVVVLAILGGLLGGCSTLRYYSHLAVGEAHVLMAREPASEVIADPDTSPALRQRLQLALRARRFASDVLQLPRNKSYTLYADIGRPFVMYNVFATPELSLKPIEHCFPIAGCVAYQGFYHLDRAKALADKLRKAGDDVYIGGVPAYSTLGHFADPILSSMNRWSTDELVGTIFHELAHQKLYVKGDTAFNESFATFVQREGLREWHEANHLPPPDPSQARRQHQFTQLVLATRKTLKAVYASPLSDAEKRQRKQEAFAQLRRQYRHLRDTQWHGHGDYDHWISTPINNAKL
ncbi:aminopeptidase, partial [Dyella sp.]|uniref:aminopeptidase n=1 Tax=Dyella sp. TaxID=1869338 RepID=UPI002D76508F